MGVTTVFQNSWAKYVTVSQGDNLTARATAPRKTQSVSSAIVSVSGSGTGPSVSSASPITEGDTGFTLNISPSVSGTGRLYSDGFLLREGAVSGSSWVVSGLQATDLYAGGSLYLTVQPSGGCESQVSNSLQVQCKLPQVDLQFDAASSQICSGEGVSVVLLNSENYVIYELYNGSNKLGSSVLGNGGAISFSTGPITADTDVKAKAIKISTISCEAELDALHAIDVDPLITNNTVNTPLEGNDYCGTTSIGELKGSVPAGGNGVFTFQWQKSDDNVSWEDIEFATTENYTPGSLSATAYFRRKVFSGSCSDVNPSSSVRISIHSGSLDNVISYSGTSSFVNLGDPEAISGSEDAGYSYQWQLSTNGTDFTDIAGEQASGFDSGEITTTTYFRRLVSNGVCNSISNVITITVTPNGAPTAISAEVSIPENTAVDTEVHAVNGTDPDGDAITYSITGGNEEGAFKINSEGKILVADASKLDYETVQQFELEVTLSDGSLSSTVTITINITDVDETIPNQANGI